MTPEFKQCIAAIVQCPSIVGPDRQRPVTAGERLLMTGEPEQGNASIVQCLRKVRFDRERPVTAGERFLEALEFEQSIADERVRRSVFWIELQGLINKLHRRREIPSLTLNQA